MISDDNVWMLFGSFWTGVQMIAIDHSTGKQLATDTTIYPFATRGSSTIEGAALSPTWRVYNYLFTSFKTCCFTRECDRTYQTPGRKVRPA